MYLYWLRLLLIGIYTLIVTRATAPQANVARAIGAPRSHLDRYGSMLPDFFPCHNLVNLRMVNNPFHVNRGNCSPRLRKNCSMSAGGRTCFIAALLKCAKPFATSSPRTRWQKGELNSCGTLPAPCGTRDFAGSWGALMAFTRPIPKPVCPCGAPAVVQVIDHYEPVGCFCKACGTREAQRRTSEESRPARAEPVTVIQAELD